MQHIDPASLDTLESRISYAKAFVGFTPEDAQAIYASKPVVSALVPAVVEAVYKKLLSFDITARSFVPRQTGYEGEAPTAVEDLSLEHPQIKFRMSFLKGYLVKLVTMDYDQASTWEYLDKVALMHTGVAGFAHRAKKPGLRVEYIHMALLLAYVIDVLLGAVIEHPDLDDKTKSAVLRAFNKVLWIQNDLFSRHYIPSEDSPSKSTKCAGLGSKAQGVLFGAATVVFAGVLQVLYQRARA
ncbi:hypothetical protein P167DRAFT_539985 [Morchella conica CCBAS932]|uniref:Globin-sensor domain-containing protein n=1 Tax=Morchella conica CCBAS932 TaxID=1392247 RepID=A0A3N4KAU8_9PEZI|nr:hypothetical protein P167DRAFT_539985 [Morchella conica CCBAS932]